MIENIVLIVMSGILEIILLILDDTYVWGSELYRSVSAILNILYLELVEAKDSHWQACHLFDKDSRDYGNVKLYPNT